ncbi:MAG: serine/threonine protein kinase/beta-lactam-binding protein with PASTA domain [Acidimicrobiales bacterium]
MTEVGLDEHVGRVLGDRYRLVSPVGAGASARVYLAEDTALRRRVAVKLLHAGLAGDPTFRKRFRAEAHSSAQLSHPNIMAVFDWSDAGDENTPAPAYLVTELLTGGSLRSMLDLGHRLSLSQALIVGLHAAEGLSYAHDNGFVHRDVKPANLLFGNDGRLRIADFGIARAVAEAAWTEPEGALVGTARYAAPEQASGSSVDGRADVYALTVTLIEAITGEVPLSAPTPLAAMVLRQDTDLPVSGDLGPLAEALRRAGRADVGERSTAEELAAALRDAASDLPRPQKLPLTGLERDSRQAGSATARVRPATHDAETGVLVLVEGETSIELSSPVPVENDYRRDDASRTDHDSRTVNESRTINETRTFHHTAEVLEPLGDNDEGGGDGGEAMPDDEEIGDRRAWPILLLLAVLAVGAFVAYKGRDGQVFAPSEPAAAVTHPVGTYVGRTFQDAVVDIERNSWSFVTTDGRADDSVPGDIIEQSPAAGTEWEEGAQITLVVSEGPRLHLVPVLVGLQRQLALAELADADLFLGRTGEVFDETAPVGQVISASIDPEVEVESGTAIDLIWSKGPAPRSIPDLAGSLLADAQAALAELDLTSVIAEDYSLTVPEGHIISTTPGSSASVGRGREITMVVSLGKPFVEVPNVVGLSAAEAADLLTAAGFVVTDTVGPANGEVLATDPPAGEFIRYGSEIVVFARGAGS